MCPINSPECKQNLMKTNENQNFTFFGLEDQKQPLLISTNQKDIKSPEDLFPYRLKEPKYLPKNIKETFLSKGSQGILVLRYPEQIGKSIQEKEQIQDLVNNKKLNLITRHFPPNHSFSFLSLLINSKQDLSWEIITWTLKSLYQDRMTQNEKLLLSRLKEIFAMQIAQVEWQEIIKEMKTLALKSNGWIYLSSLTNNELPDLFLHDYIDPVTKNQSLQISLNPNIYTLLPEDVCDLNSQNAEDQQLWQAFRKFVESFFSIKEMNFNWTSSIETSGNQGKKKKNNQVISYHKPAIPGGKYGFAQFLQFCGTHPIFQFQIASLGKLSMIIQEAIKRKIIVYYRTLLVKNQEPIFEWQWNLSYQMQEFSEQKSFELIMQNNPQLVKKLTIILDSIREILQENPQGISLARIPKLLQNKGIYLNISEFGLTKLKSLLTLIQNVIIENPGSTLAYARLQQQSQSHYIYPTNTEKLHLKIKQVLKQTPLIQLETLYSKLPNSFNATIDTLFQYLNENKSLLHIELIISPNIKQSTIIYNQQRNAIKDLQLKKQNSNKFRKFSQQEIANKKTIYEQVSFSDKRSNKNFTQENESTMNNNFWLSGDFDEISKADWNYNNNQSWNDQLQPNQNMLNNYIKINQEK